MDFFTFLDSAVALLPYFERCAGAGLLSADRGTDTAKLLTELRGFGREAEQEMLSATGGVNTHKGAIFLLGLLTAAARTFSAPRISCCSWKKTSIKTHGRWSD